MEEATGVGAGAGVMVFVGTTRFVRLLESDESDEIVEVVLVPVPMFNFGCSSTFAFFALRSCSASFEMFRISALPLASNFCLTTNFFVTGPISSIPFRS